MENLLLHKFPKGIYLNSIYLDISNMRVSVLLPETTGYHTKWKVLGVGYLCCSLIFGPFFSVNFGGRDLAKQCRLLPVVGFPPEFDKPLLIKTRQYGCTTYTNQVGNKVIAPPYWLLCIVLEGVHKMLGEKNQQQSDPDVNTDNYSNVFSDKYTYWCNRDMHTTGVGGMTDS